MCGIPRTTEANQDMSFRDRMGGMMIESIRSRGNPESSAAFRKYAGIVRPEDRINDLEGRLSELQKRADSWESQSQNNQTVLAPRPRPTEGQGVTRSTVLG